ncbi:cucumisin-like [Prosopis cineraria]|uniref:cucumisin-like n=1 Tax=Prosopis cineraria TaxID=364024 RepID=UPI00241060FC|nr:cucumisin-like [Prosopis cineraria]
MSPCWLVLLIIILSAIMLQTSDAASEENTKTYIVYMGTPPSDSDVPKSVLHMSMLQQVIGRAANSLVHSYKRCINGFVVNLKEEDVPKVAAMEGVVAIFPNGRKHLHTTRSWDFIGFPEQVKRANTESDIIIGVLDSGIWPDSPSFNDSGFGPPPSKWKGACHNITCNNKIIGAKYFRSDENFSGDNIKSPIDSHGHGTHTASTAAGGSVSSASLYGLGLGTARGGVPSARIAVYKVCWSDGCYDADILAAFDEAIADGVDIISASFGSQSPQHYFNDTLAIGAFHAMKHGILTSASAGNNGPGLTTTNSVAPWTLSVAATTTDRKLVTKIQIGDDVLQGRSINTFDLNSTQYPIIHGGDAPNTLKGYNSSISRFCLEDSMDPNLVKGKIVICDAHFGPLKVGFASGATGIIINFSQSKVPDIGFAFALPASVIGSMDSNIIYNLMADTSNDITATILKSSHDNDSFAPVIASFSSRGPNLVTLDILKPDIAAPGVDILAAWNPNSPPSGVKGDKRQAHYNFNSGTSMACPHVTALAAYIKSFHPAWSPAAIKSAIMTTATPMESPLNDAEFAYGAGHINPTKALNPGLVYDANETDYVKFLCGQGYNDSLLQVVTGENRTCAQVTHGSVWDLNYPSFAVSTMFPRLDEARVFTRTVTNVGSPASTYEATVTAPEGLDIQVNPPRLSFTSLGQKQSFNVTVSGFVTSIASASLVWDDGMHQVRSPITVFLYY